MFRKIKSFLFENKTTRQTVAKNTFWLAVSNFGGRFIKAAVVIYAARILGTDGYGVFSYAVTLAGFFTLFMDPGVNAIVVRDTARASDEERFTIFSTTFVMKLGFLAVGIPIILFVAPFFSTLPGAKELLPIVSLIILFDTLREFFSSLIRAREKMEWEAGIFLLTNFSIVLFGFFFLMLRPDAASFGWGYVAGSAIGAIAAMVVFRKYFEKLFSRFSPARVISIIRSAWPFAITGALGLLLTNTDILIVGWLRNASDVGIYSAAIRIVQVIYLIPTIIQFSTLPLLARLARSDGAKFRATFERILSIAFLASLPLAFGGAIVGTQVMRLVFGTAYAAGGLSLKILMLTMLVDFPALIISNALFTYDHQKSLIASSAIAGISNVLLDLLLIPPFGIAGSAVATLIAQIASNAYLWHAMDKVNHFEILPHLRKAIVATAIMGSACAIFLAIGMSVVLNIALCIMIYFALLVAFREPLLQETKSMLSPAATASGL